MNTSRLAEQISAYFGLDVENHENEVYAYTSISPCPEKERTNFEAFLYSLNMDNGTFAVTLYYDVDRGDYIDFDVFIHNEVTAKAVISVLEKVMTKIQEYGNK